MDQSIKIPSIKETNPHFANQKIVWQVSKNADSVCKQLIELVEKKFMAAQDFSKLKVIIRHKLEEIETIILDNTKGTEINQEFQNWFYIYKNRFIRQAEQLFSVINVKGNSKKPLPGFEEGDLDIKSLNILKNILKKDIDSLKLKPPRKDYKGYDRAKVFISRRNPFTRIKIFRVQRELFRNLTYKSWLSEKGFKLHGFTLHLSSDDDIIHYQCGRWRDEEFASQHSKRFLQLHYDPDPENIKSIVYLSNVQEEEQGPFKFLPYSQMVDEKTAFSRICGATMCGINLLEDDLKRRLFSLLPEEMRVHNIFGSLLTNEEISSSNKGRIKSDLKSFLGNNGHFILFNPLGIHSGGFCSTGKQRLNLQLIFKR